MSYALNIQKEEDYLRVEAVGTRSPETIMAVARECVAACKERGRTRILLDVQQMAGRLSTVDTYDVLRRPLPALARGLGLKVAIIDAKGNMERDQFFENLAVNMGLDLRVFFNADRALKWLCGVRNSRSK